MKLDAVRVQPVPDVSALALQHNVRGMSVLVPAEHDTDFEVGKEHHLSQGKERYRVLVLQKHMTTLGACVFLKLWEPN